MLKTYTIGEVSKIINVPTRTIKQWEKDFSDFLLISRSMGGARLFSGMDIELIIKIKHYHDQKIKTNSIRSLLHNEKEPSDINNTSLTVVEELKPIPLVPEEPRVNVETFYHAMEAYKHNVIQEVKEEIRSVVRKEILEDVKKEITKGTLQTVKSIADSIYKSSEKTKDEIQGMSEELSTLSKHISKTSSEFAHYLNVTNNNIYSLNKEIAKERENYQEECEQYRHEIIQREAAFQNFLSGFRDAAAAKEKKWWHFW